MKTSLLAPLFALTLGTIGAASAKEFRLPLSGTGENSDGNYASLVINKGFEGTVLYELIPATAEVAATLKAKRCLGGATLDGSVLSRTQEIDDENHRPGQETVKLLVRRLECVAP